MKFWHEKGMPKKKLILGVAAYGRTYTLKNPIGEEGEDGVEMIKNSLNGLANFQETKGPGKPGMPNNIKRLL